MFSVLVIRINDMLCFKLIALFSSLSRRYVALTRHFRCWVPGTIAYENEAGSRMSETRKQTAHLVFNGATILKRHNSSRPKKNCTGRVQTQKARLPDPQELTKCRHRVRPLVQEDHPDLQKSTKSIRSNYTSFTLKVFILVLWRHRWHLQNLLNRIELLVQKISVQNIVM